MPIESTFLITGFARSRTAWLANLLTYGDAFCFHEVLRLCPDPQAVPIFLGQAGARVAGTSDSMLPFYIDQIWPDLPNPKLVLIDRDPDDAFQSLEKQFPNLKTLPEIHRKTMAALAQMLDKYETLMVPYDALDQVEICEQIWEFCVPNAPFNKLRWEQLDLLRVEIHVDKVTESIDSETANKINQLIEEYEI